MKTRIVYTDFWREMVRENAPKDARNLYHYLFTNEYINMCGVYALDDAYILLETGLTPSELLKAKEWLSQHNKVKFHDGWIRIINAEKRNNYKNGEKNLIAYEKEIANIPSSIKEILQRMDTTIDSTIDSSPNIEIRNKNRKEGVVKGKEKTSKNSHTPCTDLDLEEIATKMSLRLLDVKRKHENILDMLESGDFDKRKYKTTYYTLKSWLDLDVKKGFLQKVEKTISQLTPIEEEISTEERERNLAKLAEMKKNLLGRMN